MIFEKVQRTEMYSLSEITTYKTDSVGVLRSRCPPGRRLFATWSRCPEPTVSGPGPGLTQQQPLTSCLASTHSSQTNENTGAQSWREGFCSTLQLYVFHIQTN